MEKKLDVKTELIEVMKKESALLDQILEQQSIVHECVTKKNWTALEQTVSGLQELGDNFASLEERRSELSKGIEISQDSEISPVLGDVRSKLIKSKIENRVLNEYIKTTRKFLQGVFDSVVPQRRNTLYSKDGEIVKPELNSLVVNKLL